MFAFNICPVSPRRSCAAKTTKTLRPSRFITAAAAAAAPSEVS